MTEKKIYDCIIVGGGPGGLLASTYLARYHREILLIDEGKSRAQLIKKSHNYPCSVQGTAGETILKTLHQQLKIYGVTPINDSIKKIEKHYDGYFCCCSETATYYSKTIILATGTKTLEPDLPDVKAPVQQGLVHHCLICDGYEAGQKKIAVLGYQTCSVREAIALKTYSDDITLLTNGKAIDTNKYGKKLLTEFKIKVIEDPITKTLIEADKIIGFQLGKKIFYADAIYSGMGTRANTDLIKDFELKLDENGCLQTNKHQCTQIPGLYAIGDVTAALDQIVVAYGQAAIAATNVHNILKRLRSF